MANVEGFPDMIRNGPLGLTVWLTGLPSAGKSTIARGVAVRMSDGGVAVEILDGDAMRTSLCSDLAFGRADREQNVRRVGFVARLLASHAVVVLVPVIAPYASSRHQVRMDHVTHGVEYAEVYVATPMETCARRDVKGLYARARAGELTGLTGVDDPYEPPAQPELVVPAHAQSVAESIEAVCYLIDSVIGRRVVPG